MTKYKSGGTFVGREMFESDAFLALEGVAPQLLIIILGKRQFRKHGRKGKEKRICINCDSLNITYTEFENEYGITQPRMTRGIDQLLAKGFISIVNPGGAFRQDKAVYKLVDHWVLWQPGLVIETRKRHVVDRGFCQIKNKTSHTEPLPIHINGTVAHNPYLSATEPLPIKRAEKGLKLRAVKDSGLLSQKEQKSS